jgi:hypothetical protein
LDDLVNAAAIGIGNSHIQIRFRRVAAGYHVIKLDDNDLVFRFSWHGTMVF